MSAAVMARMALIVSVLALLLQVFAALVRWEPHTQEWIRPRVQAMVCRLAPELAVRTIPDTAMRQLEPCRRIVSPNANVTGLAPAQEKTI